jgi:hypothetical protein
MGRLKYLIILAYFIIGGVIAWDHGYLTLPILKTIASALLSIILWWLILLGVNLHVH